MADSAKLFLHVTPRAAKDAVCGIEQLEGGQLEVRVKVTAAPEGGKANVSVCKVLAKALGVPKSKVVVARGETSRHKVVEVPISEDKVQAWLSTLERL